MSDRKVVLNLNTKIHTGFGIASFILGLFTIALFISAVFLSALQERTLQNQYAIGILETIAWICCGLGLAFGFTGELSRETFKRYAHLGLCLNAIALCFHIIVLMRAY